MSYCPFFKNGYFAVCTASGSNHVPRIADMEEFCFKDHLSCPTFDRYTRKNTYVNRPDIKPCGVHLNAQSPEK